MTKWELVVGSKHGCSYPVSSDCNFQLRKSIQQQIGSEALDGFSLRQPLIKVIKVTGQGVLEVSTPSPPPPRQHLCLQLLQLRAQF